ncbi:class I SAM-dependent methyltransferase [Pseudomonas sp. URMO17WK12:I12]|jgi:phosphatidylethanolamine/phosphatidyl-N-methylethanolamine N-methyltransferase|uniref:class I SAM-dependent methyltransferase n=1 Tax=Pseudomonas sp. URMO17WK12:I12 TaxID=1259797 RepID=UPI0004827BA1|nr:class I SAM-dependent methyltransferase [Pseudomonas sp. URMO17WK12:I12]
MQEEDKAWTKYRQKFAYVYDDSNYASPLQSMVMHASHKLAEKKFGGTTHFGRVLEIGAGTGEHLPFVRHTFDHYILSDLDGTTLERAKEKLAGKYDQKVSFVTQAGSELEYPDNTFDRVVAVHVLEHICQPHLVLKEWRRVLKQGGILSILIPTDPGMAWRFGRHLGPRKKAIAQGIAYDYVMAREHVNSCNNLIALLRHYFPGSTESWWPFPVSSIDLNLFFAFHAVVNKEEDVQ